jgi:hypothetical protein
LNKICQVSFHSHLHDSIRRLYSVRCRPDEHARLELAGPRERVYDVPEPPQRRSGPQGCAHSHGAAHVASVGDDISVPHLSKTGVEEHASAGVVLFREGVCQRYERVHHGRGGAGLHKYWADRVREGGACSKAGKRGHGAPCGCGFVEFMRLRGWEGTRRSEKKKINKKLINCKGCHLCY